MTGCTHWVLRPYTLTGSSLVLRPDDGHCFLAEL